MRVCFGDYRFDSDSRQLLRRGETIALSPRAFQMLELLLRERPRALSKAEFLERLWPKTFVSDGSIANLVTQIRSALEDDARTARFVRTVYGFGYAFCADVEETPGLEGPATAGEVVLRLIWGNREIALNEGENLLGRTRDSIVWLESPTVSRRHARIVVSAAGATLEDLGSKNGTQLRGHKITSPSDLADGDEIRVGSILMIFRVFPSAGATMSDSAR
jgi:DNA-binding winged helix-turn-helix (wHTH) protein